MSMQPAYPQPSPAIEALSAVAPLAQLRHSAQHLRAVFALIDELVDQIEDPRRIGQPGVASDLQEVARAAAALRTTLEATRASWDEAQCQEVQP